MKTAVDGSNKLQSENERIGGKLNEIVEKYQEREKVSWTEITFYVIFRTLVIRRVLITSTVTKLAKLRQPNLSLLTPKHLASFYLCASIAAVANRRQYVMKCSWLHIRTQIIRVASDMITARTI